MGVMFGGEMERAHSYCILFCWCDDVHLPLFWWLALALVWLWVSLSIKWMSCLDQWGLLVLRLCIATIMTMCIYVSAMIINTCTSGGWVLSRCGVEEALPEPPFHRLIAIKSAEIITAVSFLLVFVVPQYISEDFYFKYCDLTPFIYIWLHLHEYGVA